RSQDGRETGHERNGRPRRETCHDPGTSPVAACNYLREGCPKGERRSTALRGRRCRLIRPIARAAGDSLSGTFCLLVCLVILPNGLFGQEQRKGYTNGIGMKFVWIPPGSFVMGSPISETGRQPDETQHKVTLTKGFYLGVYTVTQEQWRVVMGNNPSHHR